MDRLLDPLYLLWFAVSLVMSILVWSLGRNIKALDDKLKDLAKAGEKQDVDFNVLSNKFSALEAVCKRELDKGGHK